jgi:hypothetical protein
LIKNVTDYGIICFNEAVVFPNMSWSLHTTVAAGTHLADGEFLKVTGNWGKCLKLRGIATKAVLSKKDVQHFKLEQTE